MFRIFDCLPDRDFLDILKFVFSKLKFDDVTFIQRVPEHFTTHAVTQAFTA